MKGAPTFLKLDALVPSKKKKEISSPAGGQSIQTRHFNKESKIKKHDVDFFLFFWCCIYVTPINDTTLYGKIQNSIKLAPLCSILWVLSVWTNIISR